MQSLLLTRHTKPFLWVYCENAELQSLILCKIIQDSVNDGKIKKFIQEAKWTSLKSHHHAPQLSKWSRFPGLPSHGLFPMLHWCFLLCLLWLCIYHPLLSPCLPTQREAWKHRATGWIWDLAPCAVLHVSFNNAVQKNHQIWKKKRSNNFLVWL